MSKESSVNKRSLRGAHGRGGIGILGFMPELSLCLSLFLEKEKEGKKEREVEKEGGGGWERKGEDGKPYLRLLRYQNADFLIRPSKTVILIAWQVVYGRIVLHIQ